MAVAACGAVDPKAALARDESVAASFSPAASSGYQIKKLVPGSHFKTINGLALDRDGNLYAGSVLGESIYFISADMRTVQRLVGPRKGAADDLVVTESGAVIWTDPWAGVVRRRDPDGTLRDIASNIPGVNPIAFSPDGKRLFVGQMIFGESLWEVDPEGRAPTRLVLKDIGWLNAFQVGQDGMIYAPMFRLGNIIRINPDTGAVDILATGFNQPTSVKLADDGAVLVLESPTGELCRLDGGKRVKIAQLASGNDNMIVAKDGGIFVSNMADGSIVKLDPRTGHAEVMFKAILAFAADVAIAGDQLYVADGYALRKVDTRTGAVSDILRPGSSTVYPPVGISVSSGHAVLICELLGTIQIVELATGTVVETLSGFDQPIDAIRTRDGKLLVLLPSRGELVEVFGGALRIVAAGLKAPVGIADAGNGAVLVAESGSGSLLSVDLASGNHKVIASGLGAPRAVALTQDGARDAAAVLDVAGRQLWLVDLKTGKSKVIARDLPVGYLTNPYPRSGGIAIQENGDIYIAADQENAIYRLST